MSNSSGIKDTAQQYAPWRKGIAWWVVLLQGLLLLAIGGYALWSTKSAARVVVLGFGLYLIATALWTIIQSMRGRDIGLSVFGLLAAGGGLVAGISVSLPFLFSKPEAYAPSFFTFGVALITIGILTLLSAFVEKPETGVVWQTLVRGVIWLLFGAYLVYAVVAKVEDPVLIQWIAYALLALGAGLTIFSIVLNRRQAAKKPATADAASAAPAGDAN